MGGKKYIQKKCSESTKNHKNDQETGTGGVIFESENSNCPVKSFELYLSKLNPDLTALFQRPKDGHQFVVNDTVCQPTTWQKHIRSNDAHHIQNGWFVSDIHKPFY